MDIYKSLEEASKKNHKNYGRVRIIENNKNEVYGFRDGEWYLLEKEIWLF